LLYSFEDFSLDPSRRELRRAGSLIALQPQVFDLLEYLICHRERVVSKDDLLAAVWNGRIVSESTLSTRINAARRALADSGEEQRLLRTAHGKGIRFVGVLREINNPIEIRRSDDLSEEATGRASRRPDPILAERRQLTVISYNLAESTTLAARLDPEDLRDLIAAYRRIVAEIVARFEGLVARHTGDGGLIYFGYPRAHEDDAERAIRCGLVVADTVIPLEPGEELRSCVGIATSMAVIGDQIDSTTSGEPSVAGEAPSLSARLRDLAARNSVLIADSTRRLVGELFEYRLVAKNGLSGMRPTWEVLRPSIVASRFEALRGAALTPLVGREEEIDLLLRRCARAKAGKVTLYWSAANRALASRDSPWPWRTASTPSRIFVCVIFVRPIARTARFTLLSTSLKAWRVSRGTMWFLPGWKSWRARSSARGHRKKMWHCLPSCCHCQVWNATC
jgi:DNA-binding winged helix-turn-helix (wHTH) protein